MMPLLFWLALCGADPSFEPPDGELPPAGEVFGMPLVSASPAFATGSPWSSQIGRAAALNEPLTGRSQSLESDTQAFFPASPASPASPVPPRFQWNLFHDLADVFNPFTPTTVPVVPGYYDPYGWQASYGTNGHQPWRLGWMLYHDFAILPNSSVSGGATGGMKIVEWSSNLRLSQLIAPGVLFNATGYFNAHYWDGPGGVALPGQVDQISLDMELGFYNDGPWSAQLGFHPQIVDGYEARLNRYAFNFDGRAIVSYLASPNWTLVGGLAFWDRVDLLVVPHVGAIWTPASRWELRLLYPKTRISYYLGRKGTSDFWIYGSAEYTAEAWQANIGNPTVVADRIQLTDDRISLGVRWDSGRCSVFVEGGYVFNRQAKFAGPTPNFDLSNVGMIRAGVRF